MSKFYVQDRKTLLKMIETIKDGDHAEFDLKNEIEWNRIKKYEVVLNMKPMKLASLKISTVYPIEIIKKLPLKYEELIVNYELFSKLNPLLRVDLLRNCEKVSLIIHAKEADLTSTEDMKDISNLKKQVNLNINLLHATVEYVKSIKYYLLTNLLKLDIVECTTNLFYPNFDPFIPKTVFAICLLPLYFVNKVSLIINIKQRNDCLKTLRFLQGKSADCLVIIQEEDMAGYWFHVQLDFFLRNLEISRFFSYRGMVESHRNNRLRTFTLSKEELFIRRRLLTRQLQQNHFESIKDCNKLEEFIERFGTKDYFPLEYSIVEMA